MKYFGNRLEDQQRQMVRLKEMDTAEAVQRLNEVEYGHYMFKVPYDSMKQGQQWVELTKKYLNKKVWSISTRFTGPRKGFGASTLKADATGVRVYISKKNQKNIDEERFQRSMKIRKLEDEHNELEAIYTGNKDYIKQLEKELDEVHIEGLKELEKKISLLEDENKELEKKLTWKNIHIKNLESHIDKHLWYIEKNWFEKLIHEIKNWRNK
tara:strand:+ start:10158 stop:10790 length:633 start_codon:yes stop_codon:yes gene_type:complete